MATTDSYVQGAPDSTGKKIDTSEVTQVGGALVERQRVVLADDSCASGLAPVTALDGLRVNANSGIQTLAAAISMNNARSSAAAAVGGFYPVEYPPFLGA